jgi:hypothetical protein
MTSHDWTTRLDPSLGPFHSVWFLPVSENVLGRCVGLLIPECELQNVYIIDGEPLAVVNRPKRNKSVHIWLRHVCEIATEDDCPLSFSCDTHEQAEHAAAMACTGPRRVPSKDCHNRRNVIMAKTRIVRPRLPRRAPPVPFGRRLPSMAVQMAGMPRAPRAPRPFGALPRRRRRGVLPK